MPDRFWDEIERLFGHAISLPEEEREDWLAIQEIPEEVLREVRRLFVADIVASEGFLQPVVGEEELRSTPRSRAGPYELLEELGHGGMGVVYRATRVDGQFDDQVAVKILAAGPGGPDRQRRFLNERQILAAVRHPNIAYLLDGGWTEDHRPYLVMEWVRGEPIDTFCARKSLGVAGRIRLILQVTNAIEHAHRNLVVHRDLKPSNVLVTEPAASRSDAGPAGEGRVKLLDFGIAKLLDDDFEGLTRTGQNLMTPAFASPEQIQGDVVTTASDVYQLGLLLYQLLTGTLPYDARGYSGLALARAVVEQEPIAPSRRSHSDPTSGLSTAADGPDMAAAAGSSPAASTGSSWAPAPDFVRLPRVEQKDLDAILLTALAKEPSRRYGSARELAEDLERFLAREPVQARGQGRLYRLGKWARRNRAAALAAVASVLLVVSIALSGALALLQARRLEIERNLARQESEKASQVAAFLGEVFAGADPDQRSGTEPTAKELLDRGAAGIAGLEAPEIRLELLKIMSRSYSRLGLFESGRELGTQHLALARTLGEQAEIARALEGLGHTERGAGAFGRAEEHLRAALVIRRGLGEEVGLAQALLGLGRLRGDQGAWKEAIQWIEQARELVAGRDEETVLRFEILTALGEMWHLLRELGASANLHRQALELLESQGVTSTNLAKAQQNLGMVKYRQGELEVAESLLRQAVEGLRKIYGGDHMVLASTLSNLGLVVDAAGRKEEAVRLFEEVLQMRRRILPEDHPEIANSLHNLGSIRLTSDPAAAEGWLREALSQRRQLLGNEHPNVANTLSELGDALWLQEQLVESVPIRREAVAIFRRHLPEGHPDRAYAEKALRRTLERLDAAAAGNRR